MNTRSRLLICDIPVSCKDDDLKSWIEAQGFEVRDVRIIRDTVSGTSPSFAHVELVHTDKLDEAARQLNGHVLLGKPVRVIPIQRRVGLRSNSVPS